MTEQTRTPATPERRRPPAWVNRVLTTILRSPIHGFLSNEMMLITFTGRKSGKAFTTPVSMLPSPGGVQFFVASPWYRNLIGGAPVTIRIAGQDRTGIATPTEDPETILHEVKAFLARRGLKNSFRIGLQLDPKSPPSDAQLAELLRGRALVTVTFS
jgi:hypothetical protein